MDISSIIKNFLIFKKKPKKIGKYCGISKLPGIKREKHKKKFPTLHNWRVVIKFKDKTEAEDWEKAQTDCEKNPGDYDGEVGLTWYGYKFDYYKRR